jgi:hypothetical protein
MESVDDFLSTPGPFPPSQSLVLNPCPVAIDPTLLASIRKNVDNVGTILIPTYRQRVTRMMTTSEMRPSLALFKSPVPSACIAGIQSVLATPTLSDAEISRFLAEMIAEAARDYVQEQKQS